MISDLITLFFFWIKRYLVVFHSRRRSTVSLFLLTLQHLQVLQGLEGHELVKSTNCHRKVAMARGRSRRNVASLVKMPLLESGSLIFEDAVHISLIFHGSYS
ncbi:uncharacterized protein LOC129317949 isoform X2 [Prosopis cineraria]|uniref:uncharacterized protein LOC129317949 isoform X2 n=2 Tax=Prosopis cineraria TaxID=364024 RepID=UPI00240F690D|nr:uncharacterized protein LOC129317949 isoform X2 [Prosopis cineraria]